MLRSGDRPPPESGASATPGEVRLGVTPIDSRSWPGIQMVSFCVAFRALSSRFAFGCFSSLTFDAFGLLGCLFDHFDLVVVLILLQEVLLMGNSLSAGND